MAGQYLMPHNHHLVLHFWWPLLCEHIQQYSFAYGSIFVVQFLRRNATSRVMSHHHSRPLFPYQKLFSCFLGRSSENNTTCLFWLEGPAKTPTVAFYLNSLISLSSWRIASWPWVAASLAKRDATEDKAFFIELKKTYLPQLGEGDGDDNIDAGQKDEDKAPPLT